MRKAFAFIVIAVMMTSILAVQAAPARASDDVFSLWTNPTAQSSGPVIRDYYVTHQFYFWIFPWYTTTYYVGQLHYEWMIKYIPTTSTQYDYYAIYILEVMNPSKSRGESGYITGATTRLELAHSSMAVYLDPSTGTTSFTYGTGVSLNSQDVLTFSATSSYTQQSLTITTQRDDNFGGYIQWTFSMNDIAQSNSNQVLLTALIRTHKYQAFATGITITTHWRVQPGLIPLETPSFTEPTFYPACAGDLQLQANFYAVHWNGLYLQFADSSSGGTTPYVSSTWDFGDGSTATGFVVDHTYSAPGTYILTHTVTDSAGNTATTSGPWEVPNPYGLTW
ncbi:MAG: PKD domain-containing protein [Promethearchaeati archaeon SRVP18_Atabeyarchaeia-1]